MIRVLAYPDDKGFPPGAFADLYWTEQVSRQDNFAGDPYGAHAVYVREFAEGAVVNMREMNGRDDSDFYATYYDAEQDRFVEVMYGSTRGWTYPANATIDATPEIIDKWIAYQNKLRSDATRARIEREARTPAKGKQVRILATRGKAAKFKGQCGVVFWMEERRSQYGTWSYGFRIGVKIGQESVFLAADKAEVIVPEKQQAAA